MHCLLRLWFAKSIHKATLQGQGFVGSIMMMQLAWNVKDLSDLNEKGRRIIWESHNINWNYEW